jgi:tetratricopeptide (TPR) repeat protein
LKQDDFAGAEAEYRRLLGDSPERQREGHYGLSWTSAYRGRYREGVQRLDEVVRLDRALRDAPDLARAFGQQALWLSLATRDFGPTRERITLGIGAIDEAVEPAIVYRHFYWFAIAAALAGGRGDMMDDLVKRSASLGGNHPAGVVAVEKLRQAGEDAKAREELRARTGRRLANGLEAYAAEWALSEKRYGDAVDATLAAEAAPFWHHADWIGFHASYYPRVLLLRAKARAALGQRDAALADLDRLLAIWGRADAGMPALEEARALRRNLRRSASLSIRP